ncbi:MAG: hypothetical protein GQ552_01620 [Flavobacteriaceae bacterium]|nr:hypothetical protein [Flavobacteriaceae bacterium]
MKTITIKLFLILTIPFTFSACEIVDAIDDNVSECHATANLMDPQDVHFDVFCKVLWNDGTPAKDLTVKYQIKKEYCSGTIKGLYEIYNPNNLTDSRGFFNPKWRSTYTFKNKKDRVLGSFIIAPGAYDWKYDFVYRWEDIPNDYFVQDTWIITLPINEDGSS